MSITYTLLICKNRVSAALVTPMNRHSAVREDSESCPIGASIHCSAINHFDISLRDNQPATPDHNGSYHAVAGNIAPLGLLIESHTGASPWVAVHESAPLGDKHMEQLIAKIQRLAQPANRRTVALIQWRSLFPTCSAAQATQLMYVLGRCFRLSTHKQREYCAEIPLHALGPGQLALLKGLGFNQLQLTLSPYYREANRGNQAHLRQIVKCLPQFKFDCISIGLCYGHRHRTLQAVRGDIDIALHFTPDRIVVREVKPDLSGDTTATTAASEQFLLLYESLKNAGYLVIGNDWFVRPNDPLLAARSQERLHHTVVGYNRSNVRHVLRLTANSQDDGIAATSNHRNNLQDPISRCFSSCLAGDSAAATLHWQYESIVDELLCYHRLNLRRIHPHFRAKLARQLTDPLSNSPRYVLHDDYLILSKQGILQLPDVCRQLYQALLSCAEVPT